MNFERVIWREPWLTPIIVNLRSVVKTERVETIGVSGDGKTMYYNPTFFRSLTEAERIGVQIHELLHIVNRHFERQCGRDAQLWNAACDMAINYQILRAGYKLPHGVLEGVDASAEEIYDSLAHRSMLRTVQIEQGNYTLVGDLIGQDASDSSGGSDAETAEAVESAVRLAGHGQTELSKRFTPAKATVRWETVLQNFVKSAVGGEQDYIDYTFDENGVCEDVLAPKPAPKICVLVDESGSIEDRLYNRFLGELKTVARYAEVFVSGFCDGTKLSAVPLANYRRTMTGGTDVLPAYREACRKHYDAVVVLTDGYLTFPEREPMDTVWVMPRSFGRKREVIF